MGVLNLTPDSFSDGGQYLAQPAALRRARDMHAQGAHIIDVGGESTRPGAAPVAVEEELARVIPVVEALATSLPIPISVDTSKPAVMHAAAAAGASIINDVQALQADGALDCAAQWPQLGYVLMHMQGTPRSMQTAPEYGDVVAEVSAFLQSRRNALVNCGVASQQLVFDPGIGFGKSLAHNLSLLKAIPELVTVFERVLIGVSRKSLFAQLLGERPAHERVAASVQAALLAAQSGAAILRVHDVGETAEALRLWTAIRTAH